ncbi:MAG TPA: FHA domain-containing protein [Isosphaeraceae bacterium]|jgi:pSer/pThr/pTyr-binding forkhead associated (FHA) protein|nr:FHA domain-containing protein [Isosphaeraceae bacterium]
MDYQLVVVRGRSESQILKLGRGIITAGRQEDCQLRIRSSQVSRRHCQLYEREGRLVVMDLGSSNGTFVNGKKVEGQKVLKPGDVLTLGKVKLRVEKLGGPPVGAKSKPSDTAVSEPTVELEEDDGEEYEIDFDEDAAETEAPAVTEDLAVEALGLEPDEDEAEEAMPAPQKPPQQKAPQQKPQPAEHEHQPPEGPAPMGEDAVADFLLNIEFDDDDKR